MMEWYLPITIIPGIGLLILSTSTQLLGLSTEISTLVSKEHSEFQHSIADKKIQQLSLLTKANFFLYLSVAFYVFSGILGVITQSKGLYSFPNLSLYTGTMTIFIAIILLNTYAFRAVKIRKEQFEHIHAEHK